MRKWRSLSAGVGLHVMCVFTLIGDALAVKKNIKYCGQCADYPCNLMRGLSKAYCPVFAEIKFKLLPTIIKR
ncbi:MAG: hypothetical protein OIN88_04195 [Candidatus Methanoperedens sp.]|nr:hypothetical protein [Candidatus Methanoperedens sp.]